MISRRFLFLIIVGSLQKFILVGGTFNLNDSYIGCYQNVSSTKTRNVTSVEQCSEFCLNETNNMLALRRGEECHCIEKLDSAVSSTRCNHPCPNSNACGGKYFYSVYKGKPRQMHDGRYAFDEVFSGNYATLYMSEYNIEKCIFYCLEVGRPIVYKDLSGSKLDMCYCYGGLGYVSPIKMTLKCDIMCDDDKNEICDCRSKDRPKGIMYNGYLEYDFQRGVSIYSHCPGDGDHNLITSNCTTNCTNGWKGLDCRERDCSVNNGDCGCAMKCVESIVNGNKYSECVCPHRTVRNKQLLCNIFRKNLAGYKPAYASSVYADKTKGKWLASYLTDGYTDGADSARIDDEKSAWLAVDLGRLYYVGFVVAYNRLYIDDEERLLASYFVVRLNETFNIKASYDIRSKVKLCGYYNLLGNYANHAMRVNCENFTLLSRFVIVQPSDQNFTSNFALGELEVYDVGCDVYNGRCGVLNCTEEFDDDGVKEIKCLAMSESVVINKPPVYACYKKIIPEYEHSECGLSYNDCRSVCRSFSYMLSAMRGGLDCFCGNKITVYGKTAMRYCMRNQYDSYLVYDECSKRNRFCTPDESLEYEEDDDDFTRKKKDEASSPYRKKLTIIIVSVSASIIFISIVAATIFYIKLKKRLKKLTRTGSDDKITIEGNPVYKASAATVSRSGINRPDNWSISS